LHPCLFRVFPSSKEVRYRFFERKGNEVKERREHIATSEGDREEEWWREVEHRERKSSKVFFWKRAHAYQSNEFAFSQVIRRAGLAFDQSRRDEDDLLSDFEA
jgi:hypothetical protein